MSVKGRTSQGQHAIGTPSPTPTVEQLRAYIDEFPKATTLARGAKRRLLEVRLKKRGYSCTCFAP